MTDTIIKGTGNSRSIKSAPSIPAAWEEFRNLLISSGVPIDVGKLNSAGCDVVGTPLDAAHIFEYQIGSYVGTGSYGGINDKKSLTLNFQPKVLIIVPSLTNRAYWTMPLVMIRPMTSVCTLKGGSGVTYDLMVVEWNEKTVSWYYNNVGSYDFNYSQTQMNAGGQTYYYLSLG